MAAGSGKIMATDLIDSGVEEKLKGLAKAIEGLANDFTTVITKAQEFRDTFKDDKTIKTFTELMKASKAVTQNITLQLKTQQDLNKVMESAQGIVIKNAENNRGLNKSLADLADSITRNTEASRKAREEDKKAREESKRLTEEKKKQAQSERELAKAQKARSAFKKAAIEVGLTEPGTIERLRASNNLLAAQRKMITDAALATEEGSKRYKELTKQINNNKDALKKLIQAEQESKDKKKGLSAAFSNLIGSVKNLIVSYFGLYQIVRIVKKIFQDTRVIDQMNFSMKTVIKSSEELAQTQDFLSNISKDYGLNLINLTERYVKFRAATISTKLAVADTQKIFDSFAKASGVLGLKTDEVGGVFLALEQMLSKGKVTTEELRRQLGERLPGAFNIMATSIGVTTKELDKMLKAGEVVSADVLPKFAETMERVYGIEYVNRIDTLAAAQGRLNTSWLEFVKAIDASGDMKSFFNMLNDSLAAVTFTVQQFSFEVGGKFKTSFVEIIQTISSGGMNKAFAWFGRQIQNLTYLIGGDKDSLYSYLLTTSEEIRNFVAELDKIPTDKLEAFRESYVKSISDVKGVTKREAKDFVSVYIDAQKDQEKSTKKQQQLAEKMSKMSLGELNRWIDYYYKAAEAYGKSGNEFFRKENAALGEIFAKEVAKREQNGSGTYKEELDNMEKLYESYSKLDKETKLGFSEINKEFGKSLESGNTNYEQYLRNQLVLTKGNVQKQIEAQEKLYDYLNKGKKGAKGNQYTEYEQMKDAHKKALSVMIKDQQEYINKRIENEELVSQLQYALETEVLERERKNLVELLGLKTITAEQRADVENELAQKVMEIEEYRTKHLQGEIQKRQDLQNRLAIAQERNAIAEANAGETVIDEAMANKITARQVEATKEVEANKLNAKKVAEIQGQAEIDILNIMKEYMFYKQNLWAEGTDEYAYWEKERAKITEAVEKQNQTNIVNTAKVSEEQARKLVQFFGEQVNAGFDVVKSLQENNTAIIDDTYRREMILAGNSVKAKMDAELKYYNAKKKNARKQAALDKAQAVFNIGLSTAQAIMGIWAQVPKFDFGISATALTAIVAAMGAAQIAAVLAKEVPAYEKGGIVDKSGAVMVGEKGKEMAILPSGQRFLTPETPSILNMPKGTEIIPHDETQKMLANAARNNFINETIDLSATNNYLRSIRDKESVTIAGGYKYVNKNGIKGRYALGV